MRITLNSLLTSGLILLLPFISTAQKKAKQDFIELNSGEILYGTVLTHGGKKKYQEITFISDNKPTNYLPTQIKAFEYGNNIRFESQENANLFWQVLVKGDMSLYKNAEAYYLKNLNNEIIVLNDKVKTISKNGASVQKKTRAWLRKLAKATKDCRNLIGLIQLTKFSDRGIREYIKFYNECKGSKAEIYTSNSNKLTARVGISAAGHTINSQAKPRNLPLLDKAEGTATSIEFGVASEIFFRNSLERITFTPGINYRSLNILMSSEQLRSNGGPSDVNHDVYYTGSLISLPLEIKFALTRAYPQIYVKAAFILDYSISTELEAYQELESSPGVVFVSTSEIDVLPEVFKAYGASIGSQFNLGGLKGNIEANYQTAFTSDHNPIFSITHQRIGAGIKIFF